MVEDSLEDEIPDSVWENAHPFPKSIFGQGNQSSPSTQAYEDMI